MTTQHTPTPWHVAKDDPTAIFNSMGGYITRIDGNAVQTRAAIEGNTAFIVRACNAHDELVAALQAIADSHQTADTYTERDGWEKAHDKFVAFARAALAKVQA